MRAMRQLPTSVLVACTVASMIGTLTVGQQAWAQQARASYFPKVVLESRDGKDISLYEDLLADKTILINFMYTRCDGTLCDRGTKNLVQLQKVLGDQIGKEVFIYSITLDPEHDTPAVLKAYADRYGAQWTFLTGKAEDINNLRRKLGLFDPDPKKDADRKQHSGMMVIGNGALNKWSSVSVLAKPERIIEMIERMKPPTPVNK